MRRATETEINPSPPRFPPPRPVAIDGSGKGVPPERTIVAHARSWGLSWAFKNPDDRSNNAGGGSGGEPNRAPGGEPDEDPMSSTVFVGRCLASVAVVLLAGIVDAFAPAWVAWIVLALGLGIFSLLWLKD
jgi:hypothetical protein